MAARSAATEEIHALDSEMPDKVSGID